MNKIQEINEEIIPVIDIIQMENDNNKLYFTEFKVTLHDNDFFIPVRSDGYINATILCKLGKKSFANYKKLKYTKEYLNTVSNITGIPISDLIIVKNGNQKLRGTWIHGKLAHNLSLWISTYIYVKMDDIFMYLFMLEKIYRLTNNLILVKKEAEESHKKNIELEEEIRQLEEELKE